MEIGNRCCIEVNNLCKSFFGVQVLSNLCFSLRSGEVRALVGENGAGKSTFIKILSGAYERDSGEILIDGHPIRFLSPKIAQDLGIVTIYQERNLIPYLSIGENLLIGDEPRGRWGTMKWKELFDKAEDILHNLDLNLNPHQKVYILGAAEQQTVEIAKVLYKKAQVVIMDEPTASLTQSEIDHLFFLIHQLKQKGVAVIYISHRLDEIFKIADSVTVIRDGQKVGDFEISELNKEKLIQHMIGEKIKPVHIERKNPGEVLFQVKGLTRKGKFDQINLTLRRHEIVGLAGAVGSGRSDIARAIAGIDPIDEGEIWYCRKKLEPTDLDQFIEDGVCLIPEDRDSEGLIFPMSVAGNITLASLDKISHGFLLNLVKEKQVTQEYVQSFDIQLRSINQKVQYLSGGNRQKVMLAKWLCSGVEVFIMDEPTQGVDVGAREEIHQIIKELVDKGKAILMISSDLDELMNMSHRIIVLNKGCIAAQLVTSQTTQEEVLSYAIGKSVEID